MLSRGSRNDMVWLRYSQAVSGCEKKADGRGWPGQEDTELTESGQYWVELRMSSGWILELV